MNPNIKVEDKDFQANGYSSFIAIVYPDPQTYHYSLDSNINTDDTMPDIIFNDILKKYSEAWKKLAEM